MLTMVNPIDFGGHSSKVKVTMGIIDKCGVRGDATLCVVIFKNKYLKGMQYVICSFFMRAQNIIKYNNNFLWSNVICIHFSRQSVHLIINANVTMVI